MRKILLVALALLLGIASLALAGDACSGCGVKVSGYMSPYFKMYDNGEDYAKNKGYGIRYNRVLFAGKQCGGSKFVKSISYRVETDLAETGSQTLQWVYAEPYFTENFSVRMGRIKEAFSREILHSTANQITAQRHLASGNLKALSYGAFSYGMEARFKNEMFSAAAGVYDGTGDNKEVKDQDPALDFGLRVVATPMECLEVGANVLMVTLPEGGANGGIYADDYGTNTGTAYGADFAYKKDFNEKMSLWVEGELGVGHAWRGDDESMFAPNNATRTIIDTIKTRIEIEIPNTSPPDTATAVLGEEYVYDWLDSDGKSVAFEDFEWDSFMYYSFKARFMATPEFGVHIGYTMWDPNTNSDAMAGNASAYKIGENNETTWLTPGIVYIWNNSLRTQLETQMITQKCQELVYENGAPTGWEDDLTYTHIILQTIFTW